MVSVGIIGAAVFIISWVLPAPTAQGVRARFLRGPPPLLTHLAGEQPLQDACQLLKDQDQEAKL